MTERFSYGASDHADDEAEEVQEDDEDDDGQDTTARSPGSPSSPAPPRGGSSPAHVVRSMTRFAASAFSFHP